MRARVFAAVFVVLAVVACEEEPELQLGPPRCEPARELEHERALKVGFRALFEGDLERAKASFTQVETEEPGHPEAALGLRLAGKGRHVLAPSKAPVAVLGAQHEVMVAGQRMEVPFAVVTDRFRFEDLAALLSARGGSRQKEATLYGPRTRSGHEVDLHDADKVRAAIDLVVIHDTGTTTLVERVVALEGQGSSTHFIVDVDGTIYQVLDLAFAAPHSQDPAIDGRSVAIELVNPVLLEKSGALPDGAERPKAKGRMQGEDIEQWGYSQSQLTSVEALVKGLAVLLPQVQRKVPTDVTANVPRAAVDLAGFAGIVGHHHVTRKALDPSVGFPWERIQKVLGR